MVKTKSRTDTLDINATFGMFTWDSYCDDESSGSSHCRELDFEDSRWGVVTGPNTQAVVQPWNVPGNRHQYNLPDLSADPALTRVLTWNPNTVNFLALKGHPSLTNYPQGAVIDNWSYSHDPDSGHYVPSPGRANFRFNLWINSSTAPANGQPVEVVISDFIFLPAAPVCTIELNKTSLSNGDSLTITNVTLANIGTTDLPIEYKLWFDLPGGAVHSLTRGGEDGSVVLPPGTINNALGQPITVFTVDPTWPTRGSYSINCRFVNPITGKELVASTTPFTIQ